MRNLIAHSRSLTKLSSVGLAASLCAICTRRARSSGVDAGTLLCAVPIDTATSRSVSRADNSAEQVLNMHASRKLHSLAAYLEKGEVKSREVFAEVIG